MARLFFAATERNREPIRDVLADWLPDTGRLLELASGSGEHAAHLAPRFPGITWQPSDREPEHLASIAAWRDALPSPNLLPPLLLDVREEPWPIEPVDVVFCVNMIHIAPWACSEALIRGAGQVLGADGQLITYGPYRVDGRHTAPSNEAFDQSLRARNPEWGVRDTAELARLATEHGLVLVEQREVPANNRMLRFRRV